MKNLLLLSVSTLLMAIISGCNCDENCTSIERNIQVNLLTNPTDLDAGIKMKTYQQGTNILIDSTIFTDLPKIQNDNGEGVFFNFISNSTTEYRFYYPNEESPFLKLSNITYKKSLCKSCGKKYYIEQLDNLGIVTNYAVEKSSDWISLY